MTTALGKRGVFERAEVKSKNGGHRMGTGWAQTKKGLADNCQPIDFIGAPDKIRTCDPCLRRAVLYPAELRARRAVVYTS